MEGLGGQLNLDEDFDPQAYDQSMGEVFGDEYYERGEDEGKPDIGGGCGVVWVGVSYLLLYMQKRNCGRRSFTVRTLALM